MSHLFAQHNFYMVNTVIAQFEANDRKIFWIIASLGAITLFAYAYFVSVSVLAVVGRKEAELRGGRESAKVAELESQYALLDGSIDLKMAEERGFLPVSLPRYIKNENAESGLSLGGGAGGR